VFGEAKLLFVFAVIFLKNNYGLVYLTYPTLRES